MPLYAGHNGDAESHHHHTAAQYCYSSNESVNKLFASLSTFVKEHNITLRTFDVHTKLNVADNPSRRKKVSSLLAHATTEILLDGRPDTRQNSTTRTHDPPTT